MVRLDKYINRLCEHLQEIDGPESIVIGYTYDLRSFRRLYIGVFKNGRHRHYTGLDGSRDQALEDWTNEAYIRSALRNNFVERNKVHVLPYCNVDLLVDEYV